MKKISLFFILSLLVFSCCIDSGEDEVNQVNTNGETSYLSYNWMTPYIEDDNWLSYTPNIFGNWVFEESAILTVRAIENGFNLKSIDIQTGQNNGLGRTSIQTRKASMDDFL